MGKLCHMIHGLKPTIFMILIQISLAVVNVFYKLVSNDGMSMAIMVAYRFMFAAAVVIPLALYVERNSRPQLTWTIVLQAFLCALFGGSLAQNMYAQSLVMTSATFASAMTNLIPAITFILATIFRLEKFELKSMAGKAKVIGTLTCIGGAMLLTFCRGVEIKMGSLSFDLLKHKDDQAGHLANSQKKYMNHIIGPILALLCCFNSSIGLIFQAKVSHLYPCHYSSAALVSVMGFVQATVFALCIERDRSQWKLGWNLRLLAVAYSGTVGSGIIIVFSMWCVRMRGPLFVSVFSPLLLVLVAIAGFLFLNEKLYLGSILGAAVIVCGLYSVLWGKSKEMKRITQLMPSRSIEKFDQQNELAETMGTPETNKDSITKSINVIGVAPTSFLTPDFDASHHIEEDREVGNSNTNDKV